MKALRLVTDQVQRAAMTEEKALEERAQAVEWMEKAKRQFTEAVEAGMRGDPDTEKLTREALAAQEGARKRLAEADATLEAVRQAQADQARQAQALAVEKRWQEAAELCKQREKAAERAQRAAVELGKSWTEMVDLQQKIIGTVPTNARRTRIASEWVDAAKSSLEGQVCLASNGALNGHARGHYTVGEFRPHAVDVPAQVRAQHRRILLRDGATPILTKEAPDGNAA